MAKTDVSWQEHKGKLEDAVIISECGKWSFPVPARLFYGLARKGIALLREHQHGTFKEDKEISLRIRKARAEYDGLLIVSIYINDELITDIWCDTISHIGASYLLNLKGVNICGIGAEKIEIAEDLKKHIEKKEA